MHPTPGLASVLDIARIGLSLAKRKAIGRCRPARQRVEDLAGQVVALLAPLDLGEKVLVLGSASKVVEKPLIDQVEKSFAHTCVQPARKETPCHFEKNVVEPVRRRGCTAPVEGARQALEQLLTLELPAGPLSVVYEALHELERAGRRLSADEHAALRCWLAGGTNELDGERRGRLEEDVAEAAVRVALRLAELET